MPGAQNMVSMTTHCVACSIETKAQKTAVNNSLMLLIYLLNNEKKIALDVLTSWWVLNRGVFLLELSQITEILISTWLVLVQFRSPRASIRMVVFRMILI